MTKIKKKLFNDQIWYLLVRYLLFAVVLAFVISFIDNKGYAVKLGLPSIFLMRGSLASDILTNLSGTLLSITTFMFSTTLVVLTMHASQFSPRIVGNFIMDKTTIKVLGVFLGGFIYCIISLFFLKYSLYESMIISASVAIIYACVCVVYFVRYVNFVSDYIQVNNVIQKIYDETEILLDQEECFIKDHGILMDYQIPENWSQIDLSSQDDGYVDEVYFDKILELLEPYNGILYLQKHYDDHVFEKEKIGIILYESDSFDAEKHKIQASEILKNITVQNHRDITGNYRFNIQKLSEIAIRALSPSVNDPFTAIRCIHHLAKALRRFADGNEKYISIRNEKKNAQIIIPSTDLKEDLETAYQAILHYGKQDPIVVRALLEALVSIRVHSTGDNKITVDKMAEHVKTVAQNSIKTSETDVMLVEDYYQENFKA